MAARAPSQVAFLDPDQLPEDPVDNNKATRKRRISVYDAVAGRVGVHGLISKEPIYSSTRDTVSTSTKPLPPQDVLFRLKNAATRYAESDIYFANEKNSVEGLPESDHLKALHTYTSHFYSRGTENRGYGDWRTMDETALIALGILMEEALRDVLGKTGDLVFTEGEEPEEVHKKKGRPSKKRRIEDVD